EVRVHGHRAAQAPAVGVAGVGVGGDVAALHVVVLDAVGRGGGEGHGGGEGEGKDVTLHEVDLHVVVVGPVESAGRGGILCARSQHGLNSGLFGTGIVRVRCSTRRA